jgi:hypothetical protein
MRCLIAVLTVAFAAVALNSPVWAYVGVTDPCPIQTPYPPPGAPWAAVNNPSFEGGFTSGGANQWVAWKDPDFTGQIHYAGSDQKHDGTYSQKLVLPQPTSQGHEAGIYQQIYVVPNASYTVTAWIRVRFSPQTYNGEDLLAWLGVDPFGQASGNGYGMVWSTEVATQNTWISKSVTVQAVFPVMTIGLKGARKWPQHGDGAEVWFDQVTISGPIPTTPPPGPDTDPVDPETLIPKTMGPNLVANPSFEQSFADGVCSGWNKWWTSGTGAWKRSQRLGKIGGGRYDCCCLPELGAMNAKTILFYGGTPPPGNPSDGGGNGTYSDIEYLMNNFPQLEDTIFIGRPAVDDNWGTYKSDPVRYGRQLADQLYIKQQQFPRFDCWQGVNEPDWGGTWQTVLQFEKAYADRLHELGMKSCSLNLSTGSPGNIWRMIDETFDPSGRDLLAVADYLGQHCYGGPSDDLMIVNQHLDDVCSFAMRPRRFWDMYNRRGWRFPPVIATEGSTWGGDNDSWGDTVISNDLTSMGNYMNANNWWCGYTNFVVGASCSWGGFEIGNHPAIMSAVSTWNYNHPCDAKEGYYSQMFGAGNVHPKTLAEATPAGLFNGGVNQAVGGLINGEAYLLIAWVKYEFRGQQPTQLKFHLGVDPTGQTSNGNAATIDWGVDQVAGKAKVHEIFTHVWRTFTAGGPTASIWLRSSQAISNPSFKFYVDQVEVRQLDDAPPGPSIEVSPLQISRSTSCGVNPANDTFTVRNGGAAGTITYSLQEGCPWLSLTPTSGTSSGEPDIISLSYDVSGLAPGVYVCPITVTAPEAVNSPLTALTVTLTISAVAADFDQDCDVDQADFGLMQSCMTGPGVVLTDPNCNKADLDGDDDVDAADFSILQLCLNGPDRPPLAGCP